MSVMHWWGETSVLKLLRTAFIGTSSLLKTGDYWNVVAVKDGKLEHRIYFNGVTWSCLRHAFCILKSEFTELICCLIAALIFSAGYYCARIFTIQRIWIVLGRCLFTTRRGVLEKSFFFNQFYWSEFWSGKWNAWKNLEWFGCWIKVKSGAKREWFFVHTAVFERARNWCVKKFSLSERNFFVHVRLLKAFFAIFLVYEVWLWYCIGFGLVLIGIEGFK